MEDADVIVVGAGPVGLMLAGELGLAGVRPLVLEQDQFWTSEILIEALRHRARVVEVPVTIAVRSSGASKKPGNLRYGWNFSKVIIQTWLR